MTQGPEAATALTSGAVDMIEVEPENYPQLKSDSNIGISVTKSYDDMEIELRQNTGPFANEKVQGGSRVRREPRRPQQGRLRRTGRPGLPARSHVVAGLLQVAGDLRTPTTPPRPRRCSRRPATRRA